MLANFAVLDGGTLIAIQRSLVGAMVETSMPYQNGSQICWQERQQWGDNPQWYPVCHPIPSNYLQPVYTGGGGGGGGGVAPSPTVPDGVVRTQPVTKITDPVGGTVPTVPGVPKSPIVPGDGGVDIVGGITGDYFGPVTQAPEPDKPFPWGLLVVAALTLAG